MRTYTTPLGPLLPLLLGRSSLINKRSWCGLAVQDRNRCFRELNAWEALPMKAMKAKAMKNISTRLAKRRVFQATLAKTRGGLQQGDIMLTEHHRVVSKKRSDISLQLKWPHTCVAERERLSITVFVPAKKVVKSGSFAKRLMSKQLSDGSR